MNFDLKVVYDICMKIVALAQTLWDFLFQEVQIGSWTFSMWEILGGGGLIVLLIAVLIKKLVPLT